MTRKVKHGPERFIAPLSPHSLCDHHGRASVTLHLYVVRAGVGVLYPFLFLGLHQVVYSLRPDWSAAARIHHDYVCRGLGASTSSASGKHWARTQYCQSNWWRRRQKSPSPVLMTIDLCGLLLALWVT